MNTHTVTLSKLNETNDPKSLGGEMLGDDGSAAALDWREGDSSIEKAVRCCGCGSAISVAESRVAKLGDTHVFSCSEKCELDYETTR